MSLLNHHLIGVVGSAGLALRCRQALQAQTDLRAAYRDDAAWFGVGGGDRVTCAQTEAWSVMARARLDNSEALHRDLQGSGLNARLASPAALIGHAYERWGKAVCAKLLGDWVFVLWDRKAKRALLARDHHGTGELYLRPLGEGLAFSSSLPALLTCAEGVPRLNRLQLARIFGAFTGDDRTETVYEGIHQLPPAHAAIWESGRWRVRRYWDLSEAAPVRLARDDDYVDAFREVFAEAVAVRRVGDRPVAYTLSAGLDASSVLAEAARQQEPGAGALQAFTAVPAHPTDHWVGERRIGDESFLAAASAAHIGNVQLTTLDAEDISPLTGVCHAQARLRQPLRGAANSYWLLALFEQLAGQGFGALMVAQYGNASASWTGDVRLHLRDLLRQGRLGDYWRYGGDLKRQRGLSTPGLLRRMVLSPLLGSGAALRAFRRSGGARRWIDLSPLSAPFAESIDFEGQQRDSDYFRSLLDPGTRRFAMMSAGLFSANGPTAALALHHGIELRDPMSDVRLLEFCFGIPEGQYCLAGGSRTLIRRAMQGRLPEAVLTERRKGLQAADIVPRLRLEEASIRRALSDYASSDLAQEVMDLKKLGAVLDTAINRSGPDVTHMASAVLMPGLMLGQFLLGFERGDGSAADVDSAAAHRDNSHPSRRREAARP